MAKPKQSKRTTPGWVQESRKHIWLPYAQMQTTPDPLPVVGADGCTITLADGRTLIDGTASWWSACHGYNHPHIVNAITQQVEALPHVMFAGLTHEPAVKLASRLVDITPPGLDHVFFSDSGSTAVEVALKMAAQFWRNQGHGHRSRFIAFRNGYHGDTMGAMSLCDPERGMHAAFNHYMPMQFSVDVPGDEYGFAEFEELVQGLHKQIAGIVIEPLVQAAGGFKFHSPDVLAEIYRIAKKYNLLFIADEIATGFGRTGLMFACAEAGITPDIMCIGKALTGGAVTLAATLATGEIFNAFLGDDLHKAFMHGPTYMANPLACAAANASLDLFAREPRLEQVEHIELFLSKALEPCRGLKHVRDVRVKGAIGVVEYDPDGIDMWWLRKRYVEEGIWMRPFSDVIYIVPAFIITDDELMNICTVTVQLLKEWSERH